MWLRGSHYALSWLSRPSGLHRIVDFGCEPWELLARGSARGNAARLGRSSVA